PFPLLHKVWIARPHEALLFRLPERFGGEIGATLALGLVLFRLERMLQRPCIRPHSGDLPRDFHSRSAAGDPELVLVYLFGDIQALSWSADGRELIAKITIEYAEPIWQCHNSLAVLADYDVSGVEVENF